LECAPPPAPERCIRPRMRPAARPRVGSLRAVHILDALMPSFADHESRDALDVLRHSTAHLLAAAVTNLYPGAKYAIGPPVENGFYYDFDLDRTLSEADLSAIEDKMREIAGGDVTYERVEVPRPEAIETFRKLGQDYKV